MGASASLSFPASCSTPRTASSPLALLCTKCVSIAKRLPPTVCSDGAWKWNCTKVYGTPSTSIAPPLATSAWIVWPLFCTFNGAGCHLMFVRPPPPACVPPMSIGDWVAPLLHTAFSGASSPHFSGPVVPSYSQCFAS